MIPIYKKIQQYLNPEPGSVFIEIGSERGNGSTNYLAELAENYRAKFLTVDVDEYANCRTNCAWHNNIQWHLGRTGSDWCKNVWPSIATSVSFLYLDNFDWCWPSDPGHDYFHAQVREYRDRWNIDMNNENCQQEHFAQIVALAPYLSNNAVIAMDDTLLYGVWTGKCGPVVVYLKHLGWIIKETQGGVIMTRS